MEDYIYFDSNIEIIEVQGKDKILKIINEPIKVEKISEVVQQYSINNSAAEILSLIDGSKLESEIINLLSNKYHESYESVKTKVDLLINYLVDYCKIPLVKLQKPKKKPIKTIKLLNRYPKVASIELTYMCNLKCKHCYIESSPEKIEKMNIEKVTCKTRGHFVNRKAIFVNDI